MLNLPPPHAIFFFAALGFVAGAASGGWGLAPLGAALFALLVIFAFLVLKTSRAAVLIAGVFFLAGNFYYAADDHAYQRAQQAIEGTTLTKGVIFDEPRRRAGSQSVRVKTDAARLILETNLYPELFYGDIVRLAGSVTPPPRNSYGDYLAKERVHGIVLYPVVEIIGNEANPFFGALFGARGSIKDSIGRLFTQRQAAFLSGILLGDRDEFSRDFLEQLSFSGTLHLTALSGLHITIIVFIALAVFASAFRGRRRPAFAATFLLVALFVAMTGFKVSAIRASVMASLVGLAKHAGRLYSARNAIALAALAITAWNPKAPVFDLGFQLSFVAMLSIIYFVPVLMRLPFFKEESFLNWREVLAMTVAAQVGVFPITALAFENFSFSAFPANVALLVIMPVVMGLGVATVAASFLWMPLAVLLGRPTAFLLDYAAGVVGVFSEARVPFNPEMSAAAVLLYYAVLFWLCARRPAPPRSAPSPHSA